VTGAAIGAAGTNLTQRVTNKASRERETAARGYTDRTKYLDGKVAAVDDAQQSLDRLFGVYFAYIVGINSSPENGQHQSLSTVIEAAGNFQSKVANIGGKSLAVATDEYVRLIKGSVMNSADSTTINEVDNTATGLRKILAKKRSSYVLYDKVRASGYLGLRPRASVDTSPPSEGPN